MWPFPSPLKATWYYWSVLAGCLLIATHVTTLRQNTEFHLVYVIKLSWNVVLVTFIFLSRSAPLSILFSERKCFGADQMFKIWLTFQLVLRVSYPRTVECGSLSEMGLTWTCNYSEAWGHAPSGNIEICAPWKAQNALEILQILRFLNLK